MATILTKEYKVCNDQLVAVEDGEYNIPNKPGYTVKTYVAESGTFDSDTLIWSIPSIDPDECFTLTITWESIAGSSCDPECPVTCASPEAEPVAIVHPATLTIDGQIPATALCECGNTLIDVVAEVNVTVVMANDGTYEVTILDPSLGWSFDYEVRCVSNNTTFGPFGPQTVSGSAFGVVDQVIDCDDVIECVNDNFASIDFTEFTPTQAEHVAADIVSAEAGNGLGLSGVDNLLFVNQFVTQANFANSNLNADANRTHDFATTFGLTLDNITHLRAYINNLKAVWFEMEALYIELRNGSGVVRIVQDAETKIEATHLDVNGIFGSGNPGVVRLNDADSSDYVELSTPDVVNTSYTIKLPADPPALGDTLRMVSLDEAEWTPQVTRVTTSTVINTDGSGDATVGHSLGEVPGHVSVTPEGTTPYIVMVTSYDATDFTVRVFDVTGAAVTSTAVNISYGVFADV